MSKGDSADMCARKFVLNSIGGQAEGLACVDPGVRTRPNKAMVETKTQLLWLEEK